jgi:ClpX C4-type zinc finger
LEGEIAMALTGQAKTDYQRDYMRRRRAKLAQSARLDSQPRSPLPDDEQATLLQQNKELVERTTRVTRERDRALQELEVAQRGAQPPKPVGPDHPSRCSVCLKRRDEVKAMFTNPRPHNQFFVCNECIAEMHQACNEIIARNEIRLADSIDREAP